MESSSNVLHGEDSNILALLVDDWEGEDLLSLEHLREREKERRGRW